MGGIWSVPVNLDFMSRLFVLTVASWSWVFLRPVPQVGYGFTISARTLTAAVRNFVIFAVLAIPAGFSIGLAEWKPRWHGVGGFCATYFEILIFIAWFEELFFRGVLQTLVSNTLQSPLRGQLVASCIFGLSHVLQPPAPNWGYAGLAAIAGWFYGSAFRQGGNLMACSLAHAAVDTAWRTWFGRG